VKTKLFLFVNDKSGTYNYRCLKGLTEQVSWFTEDSLLLREFWAFLIVTVAVTTRTQLWRSRLPHCP